MTPADPPTAPPENPNPPETTEKGGFYPAPLTIGVDKTCQMVSENCLCGSEFEETVANINNVTFKFYFGFCGSFDRLHNVFLWDLGKYSYPEFDICIVDSNKKIYNTKHIDEELFSTKYGVHITHYDYSDARKCEYKYYENITIPKEAFCNDAGSISVRILADNALAEGYDREIVCSEQFYYKVKGDTVAICPFPYEQYIARIGFIPSE